MSKVTEAAAMTGAWRAAAAVDDVVFAEPWITGNEYTVAVLHRRVLPAIRIETANTFYDYEAKYLRDDTKYHCPAGISAAAEAHMASLALAAFDAVGATGWGRVDFMADHTGRPLLLEINTVPGMTDHSLVPMAAHAAGIDFDELCWQVLESSFVRERREDG
jgi:D-alanine-D-alanine ligase